MSENDAPADARLLGRRLVLKLASGAALAGLAAAASPAHAGSGEGAAAAAGTLPKPSTHEFNQNGIQAVLTNSEGTETNYVIDAAGNLTIDASGNARLSGVSARGTYAGGAENVGTIIIKQNDYPDECNAPTGKYAGGLVYANVPVLYTDASFQDQPATLSLSGPLNTAGTDLVMAVDFRGCASRPDIGVVVRWTRAC